MWWFCSMAVNKIRDFYKLTYRWFSNCNLLNIYMHFYMYILWLFKHACSEYRTRVELHDGNNTRRYNSQRHENWRLRRTTSLSCAMHPNIMLDMHLNNTTSGTLGQITRSVLPIPRRQYGRRPARDAGLSCSLQTLSSPSFAS